MKYSTKQDVIDAARLRGSTSHTYRGARKYLLEHPEKCCFSRSKPWLLDRDLPRGDWTALDHNRRLCNRYVAMSRLPKYLSAADRATIAVHPASAELAHLQTLPIYARAYYINHVRPISRFAQFVSAADRAKGELIDNYDIAREAYLAHNWGRLRVHETGNVSLLPGVRETGSNRDWNKRSTLRRFLDYTLIRPRNHARYYTMYYATDKAHHTIFASPDHYRIDDEPIKTWCKDRPVLAERFPVHIQRRILSAHAPAVLSVDYDREAKHLMLVDSTGEQWHLNPVCSPASAHRQVRDAVSDLRKRRAEKIAITHPERVWVQLEDSYEAGNCRSLTDKFAHDYLSQIGAVGPVSTRADLLLSIRNDSYTRRAVAYAAMRQMAA